MFKTINYTYKKKLPFTLKKNSFQNTLLGSALVVNPYWRCDANDEVMIIKPGTFRLRCVRAATLTYEAINIELPSESKHFYRICMSLQLLPTAIWRITTRLARPFRRQVLFISTELFAFITPNPKRLFTRQRQWHFYVSTSFEATLNRAPIHQ